MDKPEPHGPERGHVALQACGVTAALGGVAVLLDIDLALPKGRWTAVVGPNGAGKSTLLKVLAGLLPHEGQVHLFEAPLGDMPHRLRARQLSWLGQNEVASDDLTVHDVVMLGRLPHQGWLAAPGEGDHRAVEQALWTTQAWGWRNRPLGSLSGGERQRVLLARALAVEAPVLLMDEPLTNLDPPHQADWLHLVRALVQRGRTVVTVLHELTFALQADELVIMRGGCVVHQGPANAVPAHRALEEVFDHRIAVHGLAGQWVTLPA